ncbi:MAG: dephospho-CoA kinase [Thermoanaerobaculia bacterium]
MSRFLVGLTGGIAAGKSTVASLLRDAGLTVVDADLTVAELYRPGGGGAAVVAELFGDEFLTAEGGVDHQRLAVEVFSDPVARIHPLVRQSFRRTAAAEEGVVVLEATLLVEAGYGPDFDLVVTVEADPEVRLRRAMARGLDEESAHARLAAQGAGADRRAVADFEIRNDGDRDDLVRQVQALLRRIATQVARAEGAGDER